MKLTVTLPALSPPDVAGSGDPYADVFVVVAWEKGVGDVVRAGETLALVRPGLLTREGPSLPVPSPAFGVLAKRAALPGEAVEVGEPLAVLSGVPAPVSGESSGAPAPPPVYEPVGPEEVAARSPWEIAVARHHARAWAESPHVFTVAVADVTEAVRLAARVARGETVSGAPMEVGMLPFVVRAAADALTRHPALNSRFAPGEGAAADEVRLRRYVRIGVATRDGAGDVCVPVLRDPERRSVLAVAREWAELAARAESGTLTEEDVCGPTFTVAETPGDVLYQTPILHRPQAALLTFGRAAREPVVVVGEDGSERIEARARLRLCLAHDARLVDGADAAAFLSEVAAVLSDARFLFA